MDTWCSRNLQTRTSRQTFKYRSLKTMNSTMDSLNESSYFTEREDSTNVFGPQRDSLYIVIPITIIYSIIFVTGILGNIFTCIVIVRNKSMHTATNYYLFSLAISDLLLLVSGMPQEMYSIWSKWPYVFGNAFCVVRGLAAETSTNASVLTITLFTVERYLAICHPFVSHKMSKLSRAMKHVACLWVVALLLAVPQALQFGIRTARGVVMCLQTRVIIPHSFEISTFLFFLTPMVLISVLYALIGLKLRKTSIGNSESLRGFEKSMFNTPQLRNRCGQSTRRVIKMLVAVVIAFFVSWAPFHAQRLVAIYGTTENHLARSPILLTVYYFLTYTSGVFYYMSTCINPFVYHIMSNKFRGAFKNSLKHWCCRRRQRAVMRCSYSAVAFVRNHISIGSGSGNSRRNEQISTQLQTVRDDVDGGVVTFDINVQTHVRRSVDFTTPTTAAVSEGEGEDYVYRRRFSNLKATSHGEVRVNVANHRRCVSDCYVHGLSLVDTINVSSISVHSNSAKALYD